MKEKTTLARVVDTNVAMIANRVSDMGPDCVVRCTRALLNVQRGGQVVIDDAWRIIREYRQQLNEGGQPGVGDAFLKWLLSNLANRRKVHQVVLTETGDDSRRFLEFPEHSALADFDPSDQKFVAVAVAHPASPPILQGADSKWWGWAEALRETGVTVEFLCEEEVRARFQEKFGEGNRDRTRPRKPGYEPG